MQRKSSYPKGIAFGFTKLNLNQKQASRRVRRSSTYQQRWKTFYSCTESIYIVFLCSSKQSRRPNLNIIPLFGDLKRERIYKHRSVVCASLRVWTTPGFKWGGKWIHCSDGKGYASTLIKYIKNLGILFQHHFAGFQWIFSPLLSTANNLARLCTNSTISFVLGWQVICKHFDFKKYVRALFQHYFEGF